jgi:hypothetical protein
MNNMIDYNCVIFFFFLIKLIIEYNYVSGSTVNTNLFYSCSSYKYTTILLGLSNNSLNANNLSI